MRFFLCGICVCLILLSGCDGGPATGTVTGQVFLDGKPLEKGSIRFQPQEGPTAGKEIVNGQFAAQVPVGPARVEIYAVKVVGQRPAYDAPDSPMVDMVKDIIPARYNTQSELTTEVKRGQNEVKFELTSK